MHAALSTYTRWIPELGAMCEQPSNSQTTTYNYYRMKQGEDVTDIGKKHISHTHWIAVMWWDSRDIVESRRSCEHPFSLRSRPSFWSAQRLYMVPRPNCGISISAHPCMVFCPALKGCRGPSNRSKNGGCEKGKHLNVHIRHGFIDFLLALRRGLSRVL